MGAVGAAASLVQERHHAVTERNNGIPLIASGIVGGTCDE